MNQNYEISERFAAMWRQAREDAGVTQEYVARSLGVSKTTVQNWESGISCPNQLKGFEFFQVLGLQPLPYYLRIIYPTEFGDLTAESTDEDIDTALEHLIISLAPHTRRKLLYILSGEHGSSPTAIIEMVTAHLQAPLRDRINVAQSISTNYDIAMASDRIRRPDHIQPDKAVLDQAIHNGLNAVKEGKEHYDLL